MEKAEELIGSLLTSKRREKILKLLKNKSLRPTQIAEIIELPQSNVSVVLFQLEKEGLVVCLTPNKKSWRVYKIINLGQETLKNFENENSL